MPHLSIHSGLALIDRWLGPLMRTFALEMTKLFNGISDAAIYFNVTYICTMYLYYYTYIRTKQNMVCTILMQASRHTHIAVERTNERTYVKSHGHCLGSTFFLERIIIYDVRRTSICHLMEPHGFRNYGT